MTVADRLAPILVAVAAVLAGVHAVDASPVGVFYDDAHYVILGRALALGEGYRYSNVPGSPAATHFPPGYPALLAVLWRISPSFPENIALFKMTNAALLGVVALGIYWLARRLALLRPIAASLTAVAATIAIPALLLSSSVMSEVLFLALLLPFLVVAETSSGRDGISRAAMLGAWIGVLCLVRTHGVVLIPAVAIGYSMSRRYREAAVAAATAALLLLPWLLWVRHNDPLVPLQLRGQYASYGSWFADGFRQDGADLMLRSLRDNLVTSYAILARSFSLARHRMADALAVLAVLTLFVAGVIALSRRATITVAFVVLYLASVLVWPFSPLRFIWGVWPLLVVIMVAGAAILWRAPLMPRWAWLSRGLGAASVAVALAGAVNFNVMGYTNAWWATVSRSFSPRIQPQLVWVLEKTRPADVVVTDDEGAVFLYTGRRALPASGFTAWQYVVPPSPQDGVRWLAETIRAFSPAYVVAWSKPTLDAAAALAARRPPLLVQVDTIPTGRVYRPTAATSSAPSPVR